MVRRRRRSFRRRSKRRRYGYRRRGRRTYRLAKRAARAVINRTAEKKYLDINFDHTINTDGGTYPLIRYSDIPQGTGITNRIGNKIKLLSVRYRLWFKAGNGDETNIVRWGMARGRKNENLPTGLATPIYSSGVYGPLYSETTIWYFDRTMDLNEVDKHYRLYQGKMRFNKTIYFDSAASAVTPNYQYWDISDSSVITHPNVRGYMRCYYIDV